MKDSSMPDTIAGAISGNVTVNSVRDGARAGDFGGFLERRVHVAQRRRGEHVDVGRIVDAEDDDQPGHRVDVEAPVDAQRWQRRVEQAGLGRGEDRPRDGGDQRRHEQRDHACGRDEALARRIGAHHDPGEGQPDHDRERRAAAAGDQRVGQRSVDIRVAEDGDEVRQRQVARVNALHDRIGVRERAEQQHGDRVEDKKRERDEDGAAPHPPAEAQMRGALNRDRRGNCAR